MKWELSTTLEGYGYSLKSSRRRISTKKSNFSRIENHAQDIKLFTLEKFTGSAKKKSTFKARAPENALCRVRSHFNREVVRAPAYRPLVIHQK